MAPKADPKQVARDLRSLIDITKTTKDLVAHFQTSLAPSASSATAKNVDAPATELPKPLDVIKATVTLLRSHTTTLSLLLLTPPLTPSAIISKISDVSSAVLSSMVAAATSTPRLGQKDELGDLMRGELRTQVWRLLGTWDDVLTLVLRIAETREIVQNKTKEKDRGSSESERQEVLAATGVVWEACDGLLKVCQDGMVGLVVKKAEGWRSVLLDAVEELKEWGEDVEDDEDGPEGSEGEDEDDIFGAANKLGKGDKELKALLDTSVKKLKMVSMLYQALIKRRLKTFPKPSTPATATNGESSEPGADPLEKLQKLMELLKTIPETVDDLASAFYDLNEDEAKETFDKCCDEAKSTVELVKKSWTGVDDEFTAWSAKWVVALDAA
jgi:hypothetical protein